LDMVDNLTSLREPVFDWFFAILLKRLGCFILIARPPLPCVSHHRAVSRPLRGHCWLHRLSSRDRRQWETEHLPCSLSATGSPSCHRLQSAVDTVTSQLSHLLLVSKPGPRAARHEGVQSENTPATSAHEPARGVFARRWPTCVVPERPRRGGSSD
jgi:hypothetical protein